jgi:hypothetical protein
MTTLQKNITAYTIVIIATASMLASTAPALAATKKKTTAVHRSDIWQTVSTVALSNVDQAKADTATIVDPATTTTVGAVKKSPVKSKSLTAIATTTTAAATSGIASLLGIGGNTNPNDIYANTRFSAAESQNFIAIAIVLFVLGLLLTGDKLVRRSFSGIISLFKVEPQPQASRSRA